MANSSNKSPVAPDTPRPHSTQKRYYYYLLQGSIVNKVYEVVKPLGHGGMGEVYLARHTVLNIYRAVKILLPSIAAENPTLAASFIQEARLAIQIEHSTHIINVMDANYDESLNVYFIVMELIDGASIRNLLKKDGPFSEKEALEITLTVGRALEVADKKHVVHRDIKPDNIMLTKERIVKLADLGIAKSPSDVVTKNIDTKGILIGTPAYVSPEQAEDAQSVDCRADIYSMGITLYEMLTGVKPYKGKTPMETVEMHFNAPIPDVRHKVCAVSRNTSVLIKKMMAKERRNRPENWTKVCEAIESILQKIDPENHSAPVVVERKSGKVVRIVISCVVGFALCLLLMSGALSPRNLHSYKRNFILFCMGGNYREICDKYHLDPPWNKAFAEKAVKDAWIDFEIHKQTPPQPPPTPIEKINPVDEKVQVGKLNFTLKASEQLKNYLMQKNIQLSVKGDLLGQKEITLPGTLELPVGEHALSLELPGCQPLAGCDVKIEKDGEEKAFEIVAEPCDAVIVLECNVEPFQVWQNDGWVSLRELPVKALQEVSVNVKARGYQQYARAMTLEPGERRQINVTLEKFAPSPAPADSEQTLLAEKEFQAKKYAKAKKLFEPEAARGNPLANFRMGEIHEKNLVPLASHSGSAYPFYLAAAKQNYLPAICKVGEYLEKGLGGKEVNKTQALEWYRRGADLEDVTCLNNVARFYEEGMGGLPRDDEKAIFHYEQSAAKNDAEAQYQLGRIYQKKMELCAQSEKVGFRAKARSWYMKAAEQGHKDAKKCLNSL